MSHVFMVILRPPKENLASLSLLKLLHSNICGRWFCLGDFNEITCQMENFRASIHPPKQIVKFQEALAHCDLSDIPYLGLKYTWSEVEMHSLRKELIGQSSRDGIIPEIMLHCSRSYQVRPFPPLCSYQEDQSI